MVAQTRTHENTIGSSSIIPSSNAYRAEEHWIGDIHWTFCRSKHPRAGTQTLVFVHGASHNEQCWVLGPHNWVQHFTERGHDVILLSLPGHYPSKGSARWQTLHAYLRAIDQVLKAVDFDEADLPLSRIVIIGHSMGGILAQCAYDRHHDLAGIVVVDCASPQRTMAPYMAFLRRYGLRHPWVALRASWNPGVLFASRKRVKELLLGPDAPLPLVEALKKTLGTETLRALSELRRINAKPLTLPGNRVLFLGAEHSALTPIEETRASAAAIGASFKTVPGGHNVMNTLEGSLPGALEVEAFLTLLRAQTMGENVW